MYPLQEVESMAKRHLSRQQARRIQHAQQAHLEAPEEGTERGLVRCVYGKYADVELNHQDGVRCFIRQHLSVVAGDNVRVLIEDNQAVIVTHEPRNTVLMRTDGYGKKKMLAANVSVACIVMSPDPRPQEMWLDGYIAAAELHGMTPVLVINKSDLLQVSDFVQAYAFYASLGYPLLTVSAKAHDGVEALKEKLKNQCAIFIGQSGVGKSSLVNVLLGDQQALVGTVSEHTGKGRHTTTAAMLYHAPYGGDIIDSPGIRSFGLGQFSSEELIRGFVELYERQGTCQFRNCQHEKEPGCALLKAVEDGEITPQRWINYKRLLSELTKKGNG